MNGFLNKAFTDSQNPRGRSVTPHTKPRIPMAYVHTHECDTFYELSQAGMLSLPQSILHTLNSNLRNSKAKVRITTDPKTGNTLAKIVKVRLGDLDVYSPNTEFDYRISINLEKNLEGDWRDLVDPTARNVRISDRNKDRVSYKHLAYQIDLTQVVSPEVSSSSSIHLDLNLTLSGGPKRARARSRGVYSRITQTWHTLERRQAQRVSETGRRICEQHSDFGEGAQLRASNISVTEKLSRWEESLQISDIAVSKTMERRMDGLSEGVTGTGFFSHEHCAWNRRPHFRLAFFQIIASASFAAK